MVERYPGAFLKLRELGVASALILISGCLPTVAAPNRPNLLCGPSNPTAGIPWVRRGQEPHRAITIFVHGVTGGWDTWKGQTAFWPCWVDEDSSDFGKQDVYIYTYPSPQFSASLSVKDVATDLLSRFKTDHLQDYEHINIVAHSLGGIVVRRFILDAARLQPALIHKIDLLYFFATPMNGSSLAGLASNFSLNPQYRGMIPRGKDGEGFLNEIRSDWINSGLDIPSYCAYEKTPMGWFIHTYIVDHDGATELCNRTIDGIVANHVEIVRPADKSVGAFHVLETAFIDARQRRSAQQCVDVTGTWRLDEVHQLNNSNRFEDVSFDKTQAFRFALKEKEDRRCEFTGTVLNPAPADKYEIEWFTLHAYSGDAHWKLFVNGCDAVLSYKIEVDKSETLMRVNASWDKCFPQQQLVYKKDVP